MSTQHTPGEWFINQYTNWTGYSIHAKNRGCIAERWYDKDQDQPYGSEIMANARLIAAAPDLLAALETAVRVMQDQNLDEALAGEFEIFTDAIAKAKGQSRTV
jgi:hypothetical protein